MLQRQQEDEFTTTEAELRVPIARIRLVRYESDRPLDLAGSRRNYRLDFSLTPRPADARACFRDRWKSHHFEPLGDLFLLPPGELVRTRSDGGLQRSLAIEYETEAARSWFDANGWADSHVRANLNIMSRHASATLMRLKEELLSPGFASATLCELLAAQAAIEIARHGRALAELEGSTGLAAWRLRLIDERLAEDGEPPRLSELAALCGISVRHLTRAFRASRGCSIGAHIARSQVRQARHLLATTVSIKEVAFRTGFSSASNFATAFRRATGETPRDFRQHIQRVPFSGSLLRAGVRLDR